MSISNLITSLILLAYLSTPTLASSNTDNHTKLSLRLIHHDSILSPFYNPELFTISDPPDDIRSDLVPDKLNTVFLVTLSIGDPPIPQYLVLDTGSSLLWVCTECSSVTGPIYDPTKSSTYTKLPCYSQFQCQNIYHKAQCNLPISECEYLIEYADQTTSKGFMALETFTFVTSTGGKAELQDVAFGVGVQNSGNSLNGLNGILGLAVTDPQTSLVTRFGNKFSYCTGNISDPHYIYNQLILGDGAIIQGYSTPMRISTGYTVKLEGISFGDKKLQINQDDFNYNVLIDSGSTFTQLRRSGFEPLVREVTNFMDGLLTRIPFLGVRPCYYGNLARDLTRFPVVTLHLAEGGNLYLDVEAMFQRLKLYNVFCLAVDVSKDDDVNVIGALAQQYYNFGFDLNEKRVSFQRIDCELLED